MIGGVVAMTVGDSVGGIVGDAVGALRVTMTAKKRRRSNISLMLVENIIFRWKPMKSLAVPLVPERLVPRGGLWPRLGEFRPRAGGK